MNTIVGLTPTLPELPSLGSIGGSGAGVGKGAGVPDAGFANVLDSALGAVDGLQTHADDALKGLASGKNADLHGTMIALEQADIALRATIAVRDKFISAYEAVMNMAI